MPNDASLFKYPGRPGLVVWFTGLSGSGKTTIAVEVEHRLRDHQIPFYRLDGDSLRMGLNSDLDFSPVGRQENIRRAAEVARLFQDAGLVVLASFISPQAAMRAFARGLVPEGAFIEVFVQASIDTCIQRDPKGNYQRALAGKIKDYTGVSQGYEAPINPDLVVNTEMLSVAGCAALVLQEIEKRLDLLSKNRLEEG